MVQLHPKNNYVVVVEVEAVDLVNATTKTQAQAQDPLIPKRPSSWTYSILKEFKTRVGLKKDHKRI